MNTQILPNWSKKIGLTVFVIGSFMEGRDHFIEGFTGKPYQSLQNTGVFTFREYFGDNLIHLFGMFSLIGMIIYIVSKEKIEDDYINKLRLESYQITALIVLSASLLLYGISNNFTVNIDSFISVYSWIYLLIFGIKKRQF
ncbi:hypothetical protein [Tenacibaculum finnmarkense]|uniref:hypothetical protein n=1 Tax=Tenacibaculum finnmarkense TaxID=2781243 RepID=UPI001E3FD130|nr:hypothetical protein [Tenacibaculum finnmarkense]MCD8401588.1 hypothetical protein [Tenacibaculum finnmarkense genomovar finnmarkense]